VALLILQAESAYRIGYYNAALTLSDSAITISPNVADIYFLRGRVFTKLARLEKAETSYLRVLQLEPNYQGAWFNIGTNSLRQDKLPAAISYYKKEQQTHPSATTMVQIGKVYADMGKVDSATYAYEKAIEIDTKNASAYMRLGHLYKDSGDITKAIKYTTSGVNLDPENLDYKYFMGSLLLLNGEPKASIPFFRSVTNKRSWHYWAHHNLGQAYFRIGSTAEGQRFMDKAKELQKCIQEVENWRNLANMNPDQFMLWVNLGNSLNNMGRMEEAKDAFLVALSLKPMNFALQNNIANLCLMIGDTNQAIVRYEAILSMDPELVDIWLNLGVVYASSGQVTEARQAWEKGLEFDSNNQTLKGYLETLNR
jgi:tetratricopeptide (TPR) repeat protein